jgi:hypothetical protein
LEFIKYFKEYWIGNIELSWTYYGRLIAANILNITVDSIPNTNNHLEAFNNQLKTYQLDRFKNGGNLLRLDILSVLLIKCITPNLLLRIDLKKRLDIALDTRFTHYTSKSRKSDQNLQVFKQVAYFIPDKLHDQKAQVIIKEKKIINIEYSKDSLSLWIKSSGSNQIEQQIYIVSLLPSIYCQCLDFLSRGGACKHIRAATIWINWLRSQPSQNTYYPNLQHNQLPLITLPSQEEALRLLNKDKDQTKELLLFEQELQDVHRGDNNTLEGELVLIIIHYKFINHLFH